MSSVAAQPLAAQQSTAAPELAGLRVLLVHQWLYTWAGAERVLEQLVALAPHADVLAGIVTPEMRRRHAIALDARESWVGLLPGSHVKHRWFLPLHAAALAAYDSRGYDVIISVSHAFEKAVRKQRGAVHVSYCLSPPRWLWDLSDAHDALATPLQRAVLGAARRPLRALDAATARNVDRFVSLSNHVAARVKRAYGRESGVVYPPVSPKAVVTAASSGQRQPFVLTLGRLVPYKRVDLAIAAARELGVQLVVAGDGPERRQLERLAGSGTRFMGEVSDAEAGRLMESCSAFVFCAEEDFGIAPVEANAHGAPVVAYARGGALETMRDGHTGVLFGEQTVASVRSALERCLATRWDDATVRGNAERFSPARFREGMRVEIGAALGGDR